MPNYNISRRRFCVVAGAALELVAAAGIAAAQSAEQATATGWTATIAIAPSLPGAAQAAVFRRAQAIPHQLILVTPTATARDLVAAIGTLGALRARDGDVPTRDVQVIPRIRLSASVDTNPMGVRAAQFISLLRAAPPRTVGKLVGLRAIDINLGPRPVIQR